MKQRANIINFSLPKTSILVLNHSSYSSDLTPCNFCFTPLFFVPKIKNEAERKAVRHYFEHPKGFD